MNLPALVEEDGSNLHRQSHIEDLDEFFKNAYAYFYHKGLDYVAVAIAEITNLAFTIFFSVFALLLDWNAVLHDCSSSVEAQRQCHGALSDYIVMPWSRQISVFYGVFILMYMLLFVCYLVWKILRAVKLISEGVSMRKFFEHKLYVNQEDLRVTTWSAIAKKMRQIPERLSVHNIEEKEIAGRIMRKENWLLAMIRNDVLDLRLPISITFAFSSSPSARNRVVTLSKSLEFCLYFVIIEHIYSSGTSAPHGSGMNMDDNFYGYDDQGEDDVDDAGQSDRRPGLLGWIGMTFLRHGRALRVSYDGGAPYCAVKGEESIGNEADNDNDDNGNGDGDGDDEDGEQAEEERAEEMPEGYQFRICEEFLENPAALRSRFLTIGVVLLLLMPFMLAFQTLHFLLSNLTEYHSRSKYLGPRVTSHLCRWQNREYNELPHELERRLTRACAIAEDFLAYPMFRDPTLMSLAHITAYLSGAMASVLLLLSIYCEGALVGLSLIPVNEADNTTQHNLLWILGLSSAVYAASRAYTHPINNTQSGGGGVGVEEGGKDGCGDGEEEKQEEEEDYWKRDCVSLLQDWSRLMRLPVPPDTYTLSLHDLRFYHSRVCMLFPHRLQQFAEELLSVVNTPLVLLFTLGTEHSCEKIISFVAAHRLRCPVRGDVVAMSIDTTPPKASSIAATTAAVASESGSAKTEAGTGAEEDKDRVLLPTDKHMEPSFHDDGERPTQNHKPENRRLSLLRSVMREANLEYSADPAYWRAVAEERLTL